MADNQTYGGRWVKVAVSLQQHWLWERPLYLKWWLDLVMLAEWRDRKRAFGPHVVTVKRGQLVASVSYLQMRWQYRDRGMTYPARATVLRFLRLLESDDMIIREINKLPNNETLVTICNYDFYQPFSDPSLNTYDTTGEPISVTTVDTSCETTTDTTDSTTNVRQTIEYIDNIERIEDIEDSVVVDVVARAREQNEENFKKFFSEGNAEALRTILSQMAEENPGARTLDDFKRLGRAVIDEWNIQGYTQTEYTAWSRHFINHIRKKNKTNGNKNRNAGKGRVADRGGNKSGSTRPLGDYGLKE